METCEVFKNSHKFRFSVDEKKSHQRGLSLQELPSKYYLSHFNEFITYIKQFCLSLLDEVQLEFIKKVDDLADDPLCMLARVISRKGKVLDRKKLIYQEIVDVQGQIDRLLKVKLIRPLQPAECLMWLNSLNKVQIGEILKKQLKAVYPSSASKAQLVLLVSEHPLANTLTNTEYAKSYIVKDFAETWQFLLFLYFGELNSGLDKFSMRDLGVLKTRDNSEVLKARFSQRIEAQDAYDFAQKLQLVKYTDVEPSQIFAWAESKYRLPCGDTALRYADEFYYLLGKHLLNIDVELGMRCLKLSSLTKAQEKYLREKYKLGAKEEVKTELEKILFESNEASLCAFAEDFYQRKYHQVKLSKLTQLLRQCTQQIWLDEIFRDSPEKGVKAYYQQRNIVAIRTENRLFNALFTLFFWSELYQLDERAIACEFDRRPSSVRENRIYETLGPLLEVKLQMLQTPQKGISYLAKMAATYYGQPNGMFRWHSKLLLILNQFLLAAPPQAVINHLRAIAKNYNDLRDGYPDLMIIENGHLRFEEVKAQGDVIRPNQLVTMEALQVAGFDVGVCRVNWVVDPEQAYVVIDVETTGGKGSGHRITEIGAVKVVNGNIVDSWSSLINPQRHIPKFITQLTGISDTMVIDAPLFCEVVEQLDLFLQGSVFVAHNVNFDYGFFKLEYERLSRSFSMPKLCTVREMRKHFPGLASYSLGKLCKEFDITLPNHHRALCDAQATAELLLMINEKKQSIQLQCN
jgi:DNA polymerase III subunit epsilon